MSDVVVAVASHQRETMIGDLTLDFLNRNGIDGDQVYIFVNADQRDRYVAALADQRDRYAEVVVGEPGYWRVHNFISQHFDDGQQILVCDDDIRDLVVRVDSKTVRPIGADLHKLIASGFGLCASRGASLWGVYPMINPFFMSDQITTDLRFLIGAFFGMVNDHDPAVRLSAIANIKGDYERTLKHYVKRGTVIRFNNVGIKTKIYATPGGSAEQRTRETTAKAVRYLLATYPDLVRRNNASKRPDEILIRDRRTTP